MVPAADAAPPAGSLQERRVSGGRGWYATFFALAFILTVTVGYVTGLDAVAATSRFLWNATALITNGTIRAASGLLLLLARGIGWRRLARLATAIMGVGLSYSGGIFLSERQLRRAKGWTGTLSALLAQTRIRWLGLPLAWKIAIVALLIASQVYLHFLFILFPIAFLVPVVRRIWVRVANIALQLVLEGIWRHASRRHRPSPRDAGRARGDRCSSARAHPLPARLAHVEIRSAVSAGGHRKANHQLHRAGAPVVARRTR